MEAKTRPPRRPQVRFAVRRVRTLSDPSVPYVRYVPPVRRVPLRTPPVRQLPRIASRSTLEGDALPVDEQNRKAPSIKHEDPLNLSILLSGGKETNEDSPSNGE